MDTISEEDFNHLLLFVPSKRQETVREAYEPGSGSSGLYAYDRNISGESGPEGNVMELSKDIREDGEKMEELSEILGKPMLLCAGFDSGSESTAEMERQMKEQMDGSQRDSLVAEIEEQFSAMPETMVEQSAAIYIQNAYEKIGVDTDRIETRYILRTGGKMLALAALGMLASIIVGLMASRVGAKVGRGLRKDVFRKVVGFSNGEFDKFSTASLITRSTNDIQQIQLLTVMILRMVLYAPIMAAGGIFKVFRTNVDMSWIIALAVALIVMVVVVLFAVVMPKFKIVQSMVDRLNLVSREILTGLQVIRAFSTEKYEEKRFDGANKDLTKTNLFVNRAMTFMMPFMMLIMNGISIMIVWFGAKGIELGNLMVGDMLAFITYTMQIVMSFLMLTMISVMLPRAGVAAGRIQEVIDTQVSIVDLEQVRDKELGEARGVVAFEDVSFRYPGADEDALEHLTFTARPGETTAIIGGTGCGKSTLLNLIPRFYDVTGGRITLDGVDIREVSLHKLRSLLGYVPQKGVLFSGDIASNLKFAGGDISDDAMEEAARIAQAEEFILAKAEGYRSEISQGGTNVSGGQKQRLSIARAIAKNPRVYLFDDSFSALDYKTDVTLRKALQEKTAQATVIIVAQRISTILHADQIIVLEEGKIAGMGTHGELLQECQAYREIARSQLSEAELEGGRAG